MSRPAEGRLANPARQALKDLDGAVDRMLQEVEELRAQVQESERRTRDVEELLRRFTKGDVDPGALQGRLALIQEENEDLKDRLQKGREGIGRILDRIRFLEEHQ